MSSVDKNLSVAEFDILPIKDAKIGVITADWNYKITHSMRDACIEELKKNGVLDHEIIRLSVPGTFELPTAAKMLLSNKKMDAVICIGCVIKGETRHDEYISHAVATGLMTLGVGSGKPVIFGVLTTENTAQAEDRSGGAHGNKGVEAAHTAIKMIHLSREIKNPNKSTIGFTTD